MCIVRDMYAGGTSPTMTQSQLSTSGFAGVMLYRRDDIQRESPFDFASIRHTGRPRTNYGLAQILYDFSKPVRS